MVALDAQERPADVAITQVAVVDVARGRLIENHDVIVRGTTIERVAPSTKVLPRAKTVIHGRGKFAIPGLIDAHTHLARFTPDAAAQFLAYGVTAIRDMGTDPARIVSWRRALARGQMYSPRIAKACGPMLEGRGEARVDHWLVEGPDDAEPVVGRIVGFGLDCVKVRTVKDHATFRALAAAAKKHGLPLAGHEVPGIGMIEAISAGQRSFEHGFYPYPLVKQPADEADRIAAALKVSGGYLVPTLVAWQPSTMPIETLRSLTEVGSDTVPRLPPDLAAHWQRTIDIYVTEKRGSPGWRDAVAAATKDIGDLYRAGAPVLAGSDTGAPFVAPGSSLHEELELFVRGAGMTPLEALRAATSESARLLGLLEMGEIAAGRAADVVVLNANPLADIRNTRAVDAVVFRGEALTRAHLNLALQGRLQSVRSTQP